MKETSETGQAMREVKAPSPNSEAELIEYINSLVDRPHDYETCVYAMSLAASATFNYVAHTLGVTGFQASCADMDFLRRSRSMEGPFAIIKAEDMVYPQYDILAKVREWLRQWEPWAAEKAKKNLEQANDMVSPRVIAHWKSLAGVK